MKTFTDHERFIVDAINTVNRAKGLADIAPKKSNTNGGEFTGPCARCYRLRGYGGNDRLQVWPSRPIESPGNRWEPVFFCRQCFRDDDPSKNWTGDLPNFLSETLQISWWEARKVLQLGPRGLKEVSLRAIVPTLSLSGAPNWTWQDRAEEIIEECMERLWSPEGALALKYLRSRKLTDETIQQAKLGYQDNPERYEDAVLWGLDGNRMRLHKGILIPEFHRNSERGVEVWSLVVRRLPKDIMREVIETGVDMKDIPRYPFVRGSEKALLYSDTIGGERYNVIAEGPLCGLTVLQEGHGEFSVGITQGNLGAKSSLLALRHLARARGHFVAFDPDNAGKNGAKHWLSLLDLCIDHTPDGGDINAMLMRGESVYDFLCRGRDLLQRAERYRESQEAARVALECAPVQSLVEVGAGHPSDFSEPKICGWINENTGEVCTVLASEAHVHPVAAIVDDVEDDFPHCSLCVEEVHRFDAEGVPYCKKHFAETEVGEAIELMQKAFLGVPVEITVEYGNFHRKKQEKISAFDMEMPARKEAKKCPASSVREVREGSRTHTTRDHCKNLLPDGRLFCSEHDHKEQLMVLAKSVQYPRVVLNDVVTVERGYTAWLEHCCTVTRKAALGFYYWRGERQVYEIGQISALEQFVELRKRREAL